MLYSCKRFVYKSPQAKNCYSRNFYVSRLKKQNFNLVKEFSYNSLNTMFFKKN